MRNRDFDFWLGTWDVTWERDGRASTGTNVVSRVDETIRELFTDGDPGGAYIGASIARWDDASQCWVQDYWDNQGYTATFRGSRNGDRMVLDQVPPPMDGVARRLVWSRIEAGSLLWDYERRVDDGSWESTWRIAYVRRRNTG